MRSVDALLSFVHFACTLYCDCSIPGRVIRRNAEHCCCSLLRHLPATVHVFVYVLLHPACAPFGELHPRNRKLVDLLLSEAELFAQLSRCQKAMRITFQLACQPVGEAPPGLPSMCCTLLPPLVRVTVRYPAGLPERMLMTSKTTHSSQGEGLGNRVRSLVDYVWAGSVNAASKDLGVPQSTLQRVVDGAISAPRTNFTEAFRLGLDVSSDWLIAGVGSGPQGFDSHRRPLVAGVPRWRRAVRSLQLDDALADELSELPYSVWRVASALGGNEMGPSALSALSGSLDSWSELFESLAELKGQARKLAVDRLKETLGAVGVSLQALDPIGTSKPSKLTSAEYFRTLGPVSEPKRR